MKEKKNIDRIFQEKFKDFEAVPNPKIWERLEKDLKREKKVVPLFPLWAKLGGVAAILILLLFVGKNWLFKASESPTVKTVNTQSSAPKTDTVENIPKATPENADNIQFATSSKSKKTTQKETKETTSDDIDAHKTNLAKQTPATPHKNPEDGKTSPQQKHTHDFPLPTPIGLQDYSIPIATYDNLHSPQEEKDPIAQTPKGKSLFDEIAQQEEQENIHDPKRNPESPYKFALQPHIAPIYYSSIGGGSALDPRFAENRTKGKVTASYGINFDYRVSDRIQLRSGISRVDLQYNTPDIAYLSSQPSMGIRALNPGNEIHNPVIISTVSQKATPQASPLSHSKIATSSAYTEGELHQEMSYLEIPLEMVYALIDRRFGIHLVGGTSALVLNNDKIQLQSAIEKRELGRAENIHSLSFTGNLGIGFSYRLSTFMEINLEPTFKYQFNGFKGATGDFKPYYLGLYSGVRFKF